MLKGLHLEVLTIGAAISYSLRYPRISMVSVRRTP